MISSVRLRPLWNSVRGLKVAFVLKVPTVGKESGNQGNERTAKRTCGPTEAERDAKSGS